MSEIMSFCWILKCGGKNLKFPELEVAVDKFSVDTIFEDLKGQIWNTEIKSPSWEAELEEDVKNGKLTREEMITRKELPKYTDNESRISNFNFLENPVKNSLKKFKPLENNFLIICPDLFISIDALFQYCTVSAVKKIIKMTDPQHIVTSILFLEPSIVNKSFFTKILNINNRSLVLTI